MSLRLFSAAPPISTAASRPQSQVPSTTTLFSAGLFNVNRTWSDKLHPVPSRLLTIIVENRASTAPIIAFLVAFTLLPGVVGAYHQYRKKPASLLLNYFIANVSTTDDVQFSNMILDSAHELAPILAAKRRGIFASGPSRPNATRLRLRIERLRHERRDGSAMQTVEELQNLLDQELLRTGSY